MCYRFVSYVYQICNKLMFIQVFHGVVHLLVKDIMSPYPVVRKQARQALLVLSEVTGKTVKEMLEPPNLPKDLITETVGFFVINVYLLAFFHS